MTLVPQAALRFTLLLAGVLPVAAGAHQHMGMAAMQAPVLGASAAFDQHGRLWVVTAHDGHVILRHSDDLGKTLSVPLPVNAVAEAISANRENRPGIAFGANGQVYVSWSHPLARRWTSEVRFARSLDGGRHFSAPIDVAPDPPGHGRSFNALAVAGNGDVVVAWIDNGDPDAPAAAGKPHHASLQYTWSQDAGRTFAPPRSLTDHSCECCRIALAREPDGAVATFFRGVYGDNVRDHAFARLHTDGGADKPRRATWSGWQVAACPEQGPGLAIDSDGVRHAVWYEASDGPAIWYGQLDPGHPPRHELKIGGAGAGHADVAAHAGNVWVAWNQVDAGDYTLMLRVSHDGGTNFGAARAVARSAVAVDSPQLLLQGGAAYVAWNTADGFRLIRAGNN